MPAIVHSPHGRIDSNEADCATAQPAVDECVRGVWRIVYISLAGVSFVLGMVGIVLPGLPTTPFLLLTSYLLTRSSPRMQRRLLANSLVGPILSQWQQRRAIELHVKIKAIALIGVVMALLICFSSMPPAFLATVLAFNCVGILVIYRLPTVTD
jgi:hypothetical protein